jgi:hypothetical protein
VEKKLLWLKFLKISKELWDMFKNTYELFNPTSQVYFHKKLTYFTLTKSKSVNEFLEEWQNIFEEVSITRLKFNEQQVSLDFSCFLFSWHGFDSIQ